MIREIEMTKLKQVVIMLLLNLMIVSGLSYASISASASQINTEAEVTFNNSNVIPVENKSFDGQSQVMLVNGPVTGGKYNREFGDPLLGKEVIIPVTQLPSVGIEQKQVELYILGSLIIILMITIKKRKGNKYHE
jgi:hypothetical protein